MEYITSKYYIYNLIKLSKETYNTKIITENNTDKIDRIYYFDLDKKMNSERFLSLICYHENGKFYDLITGEKLTLINFSSSKNIKLEDNKIYIDGEKLRTVSKTSVLNEIRNKKYIFKKYKKSLFEFKSDLKNNPNEKEEQKNKKIVKRYNKNI